MSRDDSFLHSGLSSATARKLELQKKEDDRKKPASEYVGDISVAELLTLIHAEKLAVTNIKGLVMDFKNEDDCRSELTARQKHFAFLVKFEHTVKALAREMQ